jgi:hypothetical protein
MTETWWDPRWPGRCRECFRPDSMGDVHNPGCSAAVTETPRERETAEAEDPWEAGALEAIRQDFYRDMLRRDPADE